ncbi:MAG: lipid-A-disaccharide synthase [Planctomycetota bacterium]
METGSSLFISAGDVSGDIHAAGLIGEMKRRNPDVAWYGLGGEAMAGAGCSFLFQPEKETVMGFRRVLLRLPHYFMVLMRVAAFLRAARPLRIVLVDYPGLNLQIAALARRYQIPVTYFICPQLWAWAPWRIRRFSRLVDQALVIFPFEEDYYRKHGVEAHYIGHPICDLEDADTEPEGAEQPVPEGELLALLPGSRRHELSANLPVMLKAAAAILEKMPGLNPVLSHYDPDLLDQARGMAAEYGVPLTAIQGNMRRLARASRFCFVGSGTATLEVALTGTPMAVVYRTSGTAFRLAPFLLTVPHICQVNLLAGEELVPEVLQADDAPDRLLDKSLPFIEDGPPRARMQERLAGFGKRFNRPGAIARATDWVEKML